MTSLLSHLLPYVLFVALGAIAGWLPPALEAWIDPLRVAAAGGALLFFWRRDAYTELKATPAQCKGAVFWALAAGLAAGLAWVPLAELSPWTLGSRGGFDGANATGLQWAARLAGTLLVVPFAEELLVRSLIPRYVDAGERPWRAHPVGQFSAMAFLISLAFFVFAHPEVLAAAVAGVLWTLLLMATRRLRDVILAHAVANGVLAIWVVWSGETSWW